MSLLSIFAICLLICNLINLAASEGMIFSGTEQLRCAVLDSDSSSLITFSITVSTSLAANRFLRIELDDWSKTTIVPRNCYVKYPAPATSWTQETCGVMTAPAASSTTSFYIKFSQAVVKNLKHQIQIELDSLNPISNLSRMLILSTISAIDTVPYISYDHNPSFGAIPFTPAHSNTLQASILSFGVPATSSNPGVSNSFTIQVQINKSFGLDSGISRIKLIASSPWTFSSSIVVSTLDDDRYLLITDSRQALYKKPTIVQDATGVASPITSVESPNQLVIVFAQGFKEGSAFKLVVSSLVNPQTSATGVLKMYTMEVNSNQSVEKNHSLLSLTTVQTQIAVTLKTSLGPVTPSTTPLRFFKNTKQYVVVNIDISTITIPAKYPILIEFSSAVSFIKDSEYLDAFLTDSSGALIRKVQYLSSTKMVLQNLSAIVGSASNPSIDIKVRVLFSKSAATFTATVTVYSDTALTTSVFSGISASNELITNYRSFIPQLYDSTTSTNLFSTILASPPNDLSIDLIGIPNDILATSKLSMFISKKTKVESPGPIACTIRNTASALPVTTFACALTTASTTYNQIDLTSGSYSVVSTPQTIKISSFAFTAASNHEDAVFEVFFRLTKDPSALTAATQFINDLMIPITVKRSAASAVSMQMINDLDQSAATTIDYSFPSFINIIAKSTSFSGISLASSNQVYFLTVYAMLGFDTMVSIPTLGDQFYCGSSLSNVSCYYKYADDTTTASSTNYKEWAKVIFFLPSTASTNAGYHMVIPYVLSSVSTYYFQIELGVYNKNTYIFDVYNTQTMVTAAATTSLAGVTGLCPLTAISLSGYAGAEVSNVNVDIGCNSIAFTTGAGAAAVLVTDWEFWLSSSKYTTTFSIVGTNENDPVPIMYLGKDGTKRFAVILPLTANPMPAVTPTTISVDNVVLPFSYDLPNMLFIITSSTGQLNCYKQYFNSGRNSFYASTLQSLSMTCDSQADGIQNTRCIVRFQPKQIIQRYAVLRLTYTGIYAHSNSCSLVQRNLPSNSLATTISQSCSVSINSAILTVSLAEDALFSNDASSFAYELSFYGVSIDSSTTKTLGFEIRDASGNTMIESSTYIVTTTTYSPLYITITELVYSYINPLVFSTLSMQFTTPRELLPNEDILLGLGSDLSDVNANTDRLLVNLYKIDNTIPASPVLTLLPAAITFDQSLMLIQIVDRTLFTAGDYKMVVDGILTPASNSNDLVSIRFIRTYDLGLVLQNDASSTSVSFPTLLAKQNSNIQLVSSNFLLEGSFHELHFNVTTENSSIVSTTVMHVYFPLYYAPALDNYAEYIFCRMNAIQIPCAYQSTNYRLELTDPPLFIPYGSNFNLSIYGVTAPRYTLRNNATYANETIFFAIDTGTSMSFSEYVHLTPPQIVEKPTSFPYLRIVSAVSETTDTRSLSTHTFIVTTEVDLPATYLFQLIFPTAYSYLKITTSLKCRISNYDSTGTLVDEAIQTCLVNGLSVEGSLSQLIEAGERFKITLWEVPTPPVQGYIEMSTTIAAVFSASKQTYLTASNYLTNSVSTIHFIEQTNFVSINSGNIITVTKGTYSPQITMATATGSKFIANMLIAFSGSGFTFLPGSITIYLGDKQAQFRIGAEKTLFEKQYTLSLSKKEYGFSFPIYQIATNLIVFVVSSKVAISTPAALSLPYGGCSLPFDITLTSTPFDDLSIAIQYDYITYPESALTVNLELSSYTLFFDSNTSHRYFEFCTSSQFPTSVTSFTATFVLGGTNMDSFSLTNSQMVVTMVTKAAGIEPTLSLSVSSTLRTSANIGVAFNVDGTLFWQLYVSGTSQTLELAKIKEYLKDEKKTLQTLASLEEEFLNKKTDERIGLQVFRTTDAASAKVLALNALVPATKYTLCGYFADQLGLATLSTCTEFTTLNGQSCSLQKTSEEYYFKFGGATSSSAKSKSNIYLIPDSDLETDSSIASLASMYDATTKSLLSAQLALAASYYGISFIASSSFAFTFTFEEATVTKSNAFSIPSISSINFAAVAYSFNSTIEAQNIVLSSDGYVYFIAEKIATMFFEPSLGKYIKLDYLFEESITKPSAYNIVHCLNGKGYSADVCGRAVYNNGTPIKHVFENLTPEVTYAIYYVVANEFPITPIYNSDVQSAEIMSLPFGSMSALTIAFYFFEMALIYLSFI